jgi:alginate O-acetyltransferase complex protein AlgI
MAFSSNFFLFVFLPGALALHYAAPPSLRNYVLLITSLLFYAFDTGWLTWLLVVSIVFNHVVALMIVRATDRARRLIFSVGVVGNLLPLLHYKYTAFIWSVAETLLSTIGIVVSSAPRIDPPIGISFFTFQAISYIADVYTRKVEPARRMTDFGAYHSMFPQLIAGPIVRYIEVQDAVKLRRWALDRAADGVFRFCIGLGKKLILADTTGSVADSIFTLPSNELTASIAWFGVLCYTLQIYFDFSGYSDMAIGVGKLLGFDFPENFNQPYRSRSITEFWRRWNMTLSRWFRDYLYIPLGGNRSGDWVTYRNLFIVFFLCGLWHGAGYTFVLWGLFHGTLLVFERLYRNHIGEWPNGIVAWAVTFVLLMLGWVLFRSTSLDQAGHFYMTMFGLRPAEIVYYGLPSFLTFYNGFFVACGLMFALVPFESFSWRLQGPLQVVYAKSTAALAIFFLSVVMLSANSFNPFIYFRF